MSQVAEVGLDLGTEAAAGAQAPSKPSTAPSHLQNSFQLLITPCHLELLL